MNMRAELDTDPLQGLMRHPALDRSALDDLATGLADLDDPEAQALALALRVGLDRDGNQPAPADPPQTDGAARSLPPFQPMGRLGVSLVAATHGPPPALTSWLALPVDEILLIDRAVKPKSLPKDPRLKRVTLANTQASDPQAWNAALRLASGQRVVALSSGLALDALPPAPVEGRFALHLGPVDGSAFALDIDRRALTLSGGFNETLPSMDFAPDELCLRLLGLGFGQVPFAAFTPSATPPHTVPATQETLADWLRRAPNWRALCNRHIAALSPPWQARHVRDFLLDGSRITANGSCTTAKASVQSKADKRALTQLLAARYGTTPTPSAARQTDALLKRPAAQVTSVDVALTLQGEAADLVRTRRAWLVLDLDPRLLSDLNLPAALTYLEGRAQALEMTPLLRLPRDHGSKVPPSVTLPILPASRVRITDLAPLTLQSLLADPPPTDPFPHAVLPLTAATLAELRRILRLGPAILHRRPKLFIDAQHGLGNRLRAIGSAAAIAAATERELVIIWQPDAHCACHFDDLFVPRCALLSQGFAPEAERFDIDLWNYMEIEPRSAKDAPIELGTTRDAYLRSAYPLNHPASTWDSQNVYLRRLRPVPVVEHLVQSCPAPFDVSLHIRMEGGTSAEHLPYESPENWTRQAHEEIDHWRKRSHFRFFQFRLDQLIAEGLADRVYLASDTPAVYQSMQARLGDRLSFLPRNLSDRSTPALVYALADALLLGRATRLLGSFYSSFTELAARLAQPEPLVELSGRDF